MVETFCEICSGRKYVLVEKCFNRMFLFWNFLSKIFAYNFFGCKSLWSGIFFGEFFFSNTFNFVVCLIFVLVAKIIGRTFFLLEKLFLSKILWFNIFWSNNSFFVENCLWSNNILVEKLNYNKEGVRTSVHNYHYVKNSDRQFPQSSVQNFMRDRPLFLHSSTW